MDPVTAVGLASGILTFVEFGAKVINTAANIYQSKDGATDQVQRDLFMTDNAEKFAARIKSLIKPSPNPSDSDKALEELATDCVKIAESLSKLLQKSKVNARKSTSSSLKAAFKETWHRKERDDLQRKLCVCQEQINRLMDDKFRTEMISRMDVLYDGVKNQSATLADFQSRLDQVYRDIPKACYDSTEKVESLLKISEHGYMLMAQTCILNGLETADICKRHNEIYDIRDESYRWIFEHSELQHSSHLKRHHDQHKLTAAKSLTKWLSSGSGIYHISGKPGAGKSTLMKHLYHHRKSTEMLRSWAESEGRRLCLGHCFFFKPGARLQKTLPGLYRSILYSALKWSPELVAKVFPDQLEIIRRSAWAMPMGFSLSESEIEAAFYQLIQNPIIRQSTSFCFFIDGLDEYVGTPQQDARYLVDQLNEWILPLDGQLAGQLKIIVSSRPHNVFLNAFSGTQRVRLQDVTESNIREYAADKLRDVPSELIDRIVYNAEGVFLWVVLVVRRVRQLLDADFSIEEIIVEIRALPPELEDLFTAILDSLEPQDREKAHFLFSRVMAFHKNRLKLDSLMYSFLRDHVRDTQFATNTDFSRGIPDQYSRQGAVDHTRRYASMVSGGLIEFKETERLYPNLTFTHRSVPEFLELKYPWAGVDALGTFTQVGIAAAAACAKNGTCTESLLYLHDVLSARAREKANSLDYTFIERLGSTCDAIVDRLLPSEAETDHPTYVTSNHGLSTHGVNLASIPKSSADELNLFHKGREVTIYSIEKKKFFWVAQYMPPHPIYYAAVYCDYDYAKWEIAQKGQNMTQQQLALVLLYGLTIEPANALKYGADQIIDLAEFLVHVGLNVTTALPDHCIFPSPIRHLDASCYFWEIIVILCFESTLKAPFIQYPSKTTVFGVLEKLLSGVDDSSVRIVLTGNDNRQDNLRAYFGQRERQVRGKLILCKGSRSVESLDELVVKAEVPNRDRLLALIQRSPKTPTKGTISRMSNQHDAEVVAIPSHSSTARSSADRQLATKDVGAQADQKETCLKVTKLKSAQYFWNKRWLTAPVFILAVAVLFKALLS